MKENAYIMHIFGKIELLSIHATKIIAKYTTLRLLRGKGIPIYRTLEIW